MSRIEKKCWPYLFQAVLDGTKRFDARIADFECRTGDILVLREWDPKSSSFTGRSLERKVTFVLDTRKVPFWSPGDIGKKGLLIMSIE